MTLAVVATAFVLVQQVSEVNRALLQVSVALNHHKTADEMDDALRADVARAQLVGAGRLAVPEARIVATTRAHASRLQAAARATSKVALPPRLDRALTGLQPIQETYVVTAEHLVSSALSARGLAPGAQTDYQVAFRFLESEQGRVTRLLMRYANRVEHQAVEKREGAQTTINVAAVTAVCGWVALAVWQHRSLRRLRAALVREADNRAEADLLQRSLLPERLPQVDGARLAARSVPGNVKHRVGGDWYDAIQLPSGELLMVVGDVVGHDLPAAAVMGQLRNALRAYALERPSPASILARLNRAALVLDSSDLATCVVVVLDPATMRGHWATAGHPPPLVASREGLSSLLTGEPGPPVGVTPTAEYVQTAMALHCGDSLLLYSDGLVERRGVPIEIGLARLTTTTFPDADPEGICEHLVASMLDDTATRDDVTCLLLRVDLPAPEPGHGAARTAGIPPTRV